MVDEIEIKAPRVVDVGRRDSGN
ncbi:hypothetical protein LINGRAHAP2_LOCUS20894 [Linum grandiflorum]